MTNETNPDSAAFSRPPRGEGRWAFGVCAGLARRWGVDAGLLRVVAFFAVLTGVGLIAYLALALVMPVTGNGDTEGWRRGLAGSLLGALRLGAWAALTVGAGLASALVAVFGLSWLVLLACLAIVGFVIAVRSDALLPGVVVAVAMALPAAGFALSGRHVARDASTVIVAPIGTASGSTGATTTMGPLRTGSGEVFIDLRDFKAPQDSTTKFQARSDLSRVVVALPRGRCFNLRVKYRRLNGNVESYGGQALRALTGWTGAELPGSPAGQNSSASNGVSEADGRTDHLQAGAELMAFGRLHASEDGTFVRETTDSSAPTIVLDLTSAAESVVRDYPRDIGPLSEGNDQWPGIYGPPGPPDTSQVSEPRKRERLAERRVRWAKRTAEFAEKQAEQFAGACATDAQKRERWVLDEATLPYSSPMKNPQSPEKDAYPTEVNGLGERRLLPPDLAVSYSSDYSDGQEVTVEALAQQKRDLEAYAKQGGDLTPKAVR